MERWQSRVTPRFFTLCEKETEEFPIVKDEGREKAVDRRGEEMSMTLVLSSFSLSLLAVIHVRTLSIQLVILSRRSGSRSGVSEC